MRQPSTAEQKWEWWERAIAGEVMPIHEGDCQEGFYKMRKWPREPYWLPVRIWLAPGEVDPETGELLTEERWYATVGGERKNPIQLWTWVAHHPITEEEFQWLTALSPLHPKKPPPRKAPSQKFSRPAG